MFVREVYFLEFVYILENKIDIFLMIIGGIKCVVVVERVIE